MNAANSSRSIGRSILAIVGGVLVGVVLSTVTDALLQKTGVYPSGEQTPRDSLLLLAAAYRAAYGILGAYVTARLAPSRPMFHALFLGALGTLLGIIGVIVTWGRPPALGHEWYPIALAALGMPQSWIGGFLFSWKPSVPR